MVQNRCSRQPRAQPEPSGRESVQNDSGLFEVVQALSSIVLEGEFDAERTDDIEGTPFEGKWGTTYVAFDVRQFKWMLSPVDS